MPTWSDLYRLLKPTHGLPIPPIEKGMSVSIKVKHKFKQHEFVRYVAEFWVKVLDVIGDDIVAQTSRKVLHIRRKELMIFDKSYVISVDGGWDYACEYQKLKVSKGVYYQKNQITDIGGWYFPDPLDTGGSIYSENDDRGDYYNPDDWVMLSIPQVLAFAPEIEPILKKGTSHRLLGDLYLPIDTVERNDDEDEWQYHD